MDLFDMNYEEPGPAPPAARRGLGQTRGVASTRRPHRGHSARSATAGNWRRPNSNNTGNPHSQPGGVRGGTNMRGSNWRSRSSTNATSQYNYDDSNGNQRYSQWNNRNTGDDRYNRNTSGQYFQRTQDLTAGNFSNLPIYNDTYSSNSELNRQTRSTSQLNLDEDDSNQPNRRGKHIGFKFFQELSQMDSKQVITSINLKRDAFLNLLQSPIERPDLYILILKVLTIACNSTFEQLKSNLMLDVCNSQFIINLRNYLMDLPYTKKRSLNSMYWNNQNEFWENFIFFCNYIINTFPSIALNRCRSLIEGTTKCCLEGLSERHSFNLPPEHIAKLEYLRKKLTVQEQETKAVVVPQKMLNDAEIQPPENFRELSILPQREDLLDRRPFLRPNIINGGYVDIEHYLDVQFRLLREDCFGPLRDGIHQYLEEPNRKKFDNVRIFRNVNFIHPYTSRQKLGSVVQVDENARKRFKRINWAHSKRFIYGSLVLFSKDNCKSFIVATILDRDIKSLAEGKICVSLADAHDINDDIYNIDDSYIMIESEVYFEPYLHILKALQDPNFPEDIAMSKYIVKVDPQQHYPAYLAENSSYKIKTQNSLEFRFSVLNENTWPSRDEMELDESQYEAYRLALTHEFAVIQGPPGTGKTFLGVKVARTLIENLSTLDKGCLLLLICYTNHALDQFLEAIIPITKSIVRIGGQSRNEAMEEFNLSTIRRNSPKVQHKTHKIFLEHRTNLRRAMFDLKLAQEQLDTINNGVLSYKCILKHIPESDIIGRYFGDKKDPLAHWLFVDMPYVFDEGLLNEVDDQHANNAVDEDIYKRGDVVFDDIDDDDGEVGIAEVSSSFLMDKAQTKLRRILSYYRKSENHQEKQELVTEMALLSSQINIFQEMSALRTSEEPPDLLRRNPSQCPIGLRWRIYFGWATRVMRVAKEQMKPLQDALLVANNAYEETRMMIDLELLKNIKVVGMTTSGAARLRKLLKALAPPIVIVEEAAEVMEQHIVTSLTKHCQHLILIGDHQQLRPSAAHMKLARHFNLEVSLFERMIVNDIHSRRLSVQHRMRPEIAALVSPHIYPDLLNHPSVESFPRVLGMCNNLFFFSHNYKEEEVEDSSSKANHNEADMVLQLANYLMQQGYTSTDVTILAAYAGQMFYMRKQRVRYAHLTKVKITVVDNYQGEESKIILLSLVRNNSQGNIGFLKTENRVCVALSRAKEGFYIFGNIDLLKSNSELWVKIAETLEKNGSLGTSLRLQCEVHTNQITTIASPTDFQKVPEGGCLLKCNFNLPNCNHQCPLICHGYDRQHVVTKCPLKCERVICELKHVCPLMCAQKCAPCITPVFKTLPCGHSKCLPCKQDPTDPTVQCLVQVSVTLPHCGHKANKPCHLDMKYVACPVSCDARLPCGHVCTLKCHVTKDPEHKEYNCEKPCAKAKKGCSAELEGDLGPHQCHNKCSDPCEDCDVEVMKKRSNCKHTVRVACNEDADKKPCRKNCARALPCGHFCRKKCYEQCGDCLQQVKKNIADCGHEVSVSCSVEPTREMCTQGCERALDCGHPCRGRCAEPCDQTRCLVIMPRKFDSVCGHKVALPCYAFSSVFTGTLSPEILLECCTEACGETLACGHLCGGSCGGCRQGRLHAPCTQTCNQIIICGHQCQEPCNQICPPCTKLCEVKCPHSKCKNLCGQPCVACKEPCSRRCEHGACRARCGEPCTVPPCSEPCGKRLPCEHPCRGLCGEPCPPICNVCRPEDFPKDFLGDDFDSDAKFILLEDCNHVLELENMDNLVFGDSETVSIRACPYCRQPIVNTHRYKDFVNDLFKKAINPIKERVYGTETQILQKKNEFKTKIDEIIAASPKIYSDTKWRILIWTETINKLIKNINIKKKRSLLDFQMTFIHLNILEMLSDTYDLYIGTQSDQFKDLVANQVKLICQQLMNNLDKISQQQQKDIGVEIKRLNSIIQLAKMVGHLNYTRLKQDPKVKDALEKSKAVLTGWTVYNETEGMEALKLLQDTMNLSGIVKSLERELVVTAIGLKAGHWYKCPNGHFYCIGECGGAMQVSKCIECGAEIGGQSHALLSSNKHAPEMDGSRFAAWSEEYNNMANFEVD